MRRAGWVALVLVAVGVGIPWLAGGEHKRLNKFERQRLPGSFAKLKDGRTCYELQGQAPAEAVVFVHGLLTASYAWSRVPQLLRTHGYVTLVYDRYGSGW